MQQIFQNLKKQEGRVILGRAKVIDNATEQQTGWVVKFFTLPALLETKTEYEFIHKGKSFVVAKNQSFFVYKKWKTHKHKNHGSGTTKEEKGG